MLTSAQFLSRDPAVSLTRSPYGYVDGNPLNASDPSGLLDPSLLSDAQKNQIKATCSTWQNQSLCRQAAFCAEWTTGIGANSGGGGDCRTIADIAANDYAVVEAGLAKAGPCDNVELMGGYMATHEEAERDLVETKAAFQAAVTSLDWYNHINTCKAAGSAAAVVAGGLGGVGLSIVGSGTVVSMAPSAAAKALGRPLLVRPGLAGGAAGIGAAASGC